VMLGFAAAAPRDLFGGSTSRQAEGSAVPKESVHCG
jgi:hypothetical protein